jgi:tRNA (mo5U34)-methyltransferase
MMDKAYIVTRRVSAQRTELEKRSAWQDFYWYHCIDLGNGVITDGDYDMTRYLKYYGFPDDLHGKRVLDVGRASGFFSFEFERRGADVTATELSSAFDWDFVGGDAEKRRRIQRIQTVEDLEAFTRRHITGAFHHACAMRGSRVKAKTIGVYDIKPEEFDNNLFDLVFAGSITSHLRDPILAFERLRSVTSGTCIIAAPVFDAMPTLPVVGFVGTMDSDRRSWWVPNKKALLEMLYCAGFSTAKIVSEFWLKHRKIPEQFYHVVAHAGIGSSDLCTKPDMPEPYGDGTRGLHPRGSSNPIEILTNDLHAHLVEELEAVDADRKAKDEVIARLSGQLEAVDADRKAKDEVIARLSGQLETVDADRKAKDEVIAALEARGVISHLAAKARRYWARR